jgi:hypothetical protein
LDGPESAYYSGKDSLLRRANSAAWRLDSSGGKEIAKGGASGLYRSGLDGQLVHGDGAGVTPASSVSREKRGNGGGDDADRWVPPIGVKRKRKRKKGRERGSGVLLGCCFGPAQVAEIFFFWIFSFVFCFASYLLYFGSKLIQTNL